MDRSLYRRPPSGRRNEDVGKRILAGTAIAGLAVVIASGFMTASSQAASASTRAPVHARSVSSDQPEPAFYTWQAPGGAGTAGERVIALTFDDGPGPYTPEILSVLERYDVPATFFEIGEEVVQYPQYTKMVEAAGYPVEDHTWTHPDLTTIPVSDFPYEIDQTQNEIRSLTGRDPLCVRPPYDSFDSTVLDQIAQRGLTTMSYSIDPRDWSLPGTEAIVDAVVGAAFPGAVVDMHDGGGPRYETVAALPQIITDLRADGYSFVSICGSTLRGPVDSDASDFGAGFGPARVVLSSALLVASAADPSRPGGYWLASASGQVFAFGGATLHGSAGGLHLNKPIVGMAADPATGGYWLVAADGGIFSYGASFYGSGVGEDDGVPVVAMAPTRDGRGYWLVDQDGNVFAFGDARSYGSPRWGTLASPVVGMAATPDGGGYWLVTAGGGVDCFGDAGFHGDASHLRLDQPIVGIAADPVTGGYWLYAADGGVFSYGAPFHGSGASIGPPDIFYSMSVAPNGGGYLLAGELPQ
jgi:peptidoglycan/xylan/chitin deacetylase (PgdA/CDA1 family)